MMAVVLSPLIHTYLHIRCLYRAVIPSKSRVLAKVLLASMSRFHILTGAETMADFQGTIDFETFTRIDLRVGTITAAEHHPDADRLLKLHLDDGSDQGRQICAGVRAWYDEPSALVGTQVVFVANLEPRTIRGEISQGMVLASTATDTEGEVQDVCVMRTDRPVPAGSRVS
jgi:methionine--tRNA ligase beta chain